MGRAKSILRNLKVERVISFKRIGNKLRLREQCDNYFEKILSIQDTEKLIEELQAELEQMKLEGVEPY